MVSYFYHFGGKDGTGQPEVDMYDVIIVVPLKTVVLAFMNPAGAFLVKTFNPKALIGLGASIGVIAMLLASIGTTFTQFVLCYGVIYGIGIGFCYFPPLAAGWQWLESNRGLVTGVILAGFGFGAFVFSFFALGIVNPDNEAPYELPNGNIVYSEEIAERVPTLMVSLAGVFAILGIISVILVKKNPDFVA